MTSPTSPADDLAGHRGPSPELLELARLRGVDTAYKTWVGRIRSVPAPTLVDVLAALGVDAGTPQSARAALRRARAAADARMLPRCVVVRAGHPMRIALPRTAEAWLELEAGGRREVPAATAAADERMLSGDLPLGYHTLHVREQERHESAPLISAPARINTPERRSWGFTVQLYSALSEQSWGMGDLADLACLAQWSRQRLGAGFVLVNPLHAMLPARYAGHSPYWPSSRRYPDPVHVQVEAVPEFAQLAGKERARMDSLVERGAALRASVLDEDALIDRDAVWAAKREALALLHGVRRSPHRQAAYQAFLDQEGQRLTEFATYCALAERYGPDWRRWPAALRSPRGLGVARGDTQLTSEVEFHRWLAWVTDEQLASAQRAAMDAGMDIGIVHDLAVGTHPDGADAWLFQEFLAQGVTVGAPPDAFTARGQNWQQPPWRPDRLAATGYAPFAELLRAVFRHAGAVRLDHVLGLFRLWWVPEGRPLSEGAYVRYDHEAMLAVLALEARRADAYVIGEDLGTVAPGVREQLAAYGVLGTSVLWLERAERDGAAGPLPADRWRPECLATLTTHDLPTTAARLTGGHLALRHRYGLLADSLDREQLAADTELAGWRAELERAGLLPGTADGTAPDVPCSLSLALHSYLASSPALLLGVWLPDTVGDLRAPNLPGTFDEHPNWRRVIADGTGRPMTLERLAAAPGPTWLARAVERAL